MKTRRNDLTKEFKKSAELADLISTDNILPSIVFEPMNNNASYTWGNIFPCAVKSAVCQIVMRTDYQNDMTWYFTENSQQLAEKFIDKPFTALVGTLPPKNFKIADWVTVFPLGIGIVNIATGWISSFLEVGIRSIGSIINFPVQLLINIARNKKPLAHAHVSDGNWSNSTRIFAGIGAALLSPLWAVSQIFLYVGRTLSYARRWVDGLTHLVSGIISLNGDTIKKSLGSLFRNTARLLPTVGLIVACVFFPPLTFALGALKPAVLMTNAKVFFTSLFKVAAAATCTQLATGIVNHNLISHEITLWGSIKKFFGFSAPQKPIKKSSSDSDLQSEKPAKRKSPPHQINTKDYVEDHPDNEPASLSSYRDSVELGSYSPSRKSTSPLLQHSDHDTNHISDQLNKHANDLLHQTSTSSLSSSPETPATPVSRPSSPSSDRKLGKNVGKKVQIYETLGREAQQSLNRAHQQVIGKSSVSSTKVANKKVDGSDSKSESPKGHK